MLQYPQIDPVAISLGPFKIHWYGVTYLVGFLAGYFLAKYRASKPGSGWKQDEVGDVLFYVAIGVILGGRIGSVLFYNTAWRTAGVLDLRALHGKNFFSGIGFSCADVSNRPGSRAYRKFH